MRRIRATAANPPVLMDKNGEGGLFGLTWPFCLRLLCLFRRPCILSLEPRARGGRRRERKRTLAIVKLAFLHPQQFEAMSDVQEPLSWGNSTATKAVLEQLVDDRLLPVNINSERPAWILSRPEEATS